MIGFLLSCLPDLRTDAQVVGTDAGNDGPCGNGIVDLNAGEQCDPGPKVTPGCGSTCAIQCEGFLEPQTNHCYFPLGQARSLDLANASCLTQGAHVVTFGSEGEFSRVVDALGATLGSGSPYWVGLKETDVTSTEYSAVVDQPGWAPPNTCPGCYAHLVGVDASSIPKPKSDAGDEQCVAMLLDKTRPWFQSACSRLLQIGVLCEREPPGSFSSLCDGGVCLVVKQAQGQRSYLYVSTEVTAAVATQNCQRLSPSGKLVVLSTVEEREAIMHELTRLTVSPPPTAVWIGLASSVASDGGLDGGIDATWTWDDGNSTDLYPNPWGDRQPPSPATAQAYARLVLGSYDIQLAHADQGALSLPYICEF